MKFDKFTIALLVLRPDAPKMNEEAANAPQDAHLAHLAKLHEDGYLLAAGPLLGGPDERFRGLSIFNVGPEKVQELAEQDPAVKIGRFSVRILPWMVPGGAVTSHVLVFRIRQRRQKRRILLDKRSLSKRLKVV